MISQHSVIWRLLSVLTKNNYIFNYLIDTKWCNSKDLCLAEVVDDILNVNITRLSDYTQKNIISKQEKESGYDE